MHIHFSPLEKKILHPASSLSFKTFKKLYYVKVLPKNCLLYRHTKHSRPILSFVNSHSREKKGRKKYYFWDGLASLCTVLIAPPFSSFCPFRSDWISSDWSNRFVVYKPVVNFFEHYWVYLGRRLGFNFVSFLFSLCSQMLASFQLCPRKGQATSVHSRQNTPVKNNIRKSVVRICSFDFDEKNLGKRKASKLKLKLGFCFWGNNSGKWKSQFSTGCVFPDIFGQS